VLEEYRAACLIALGREREARAVIAALVRAKPLEPASRLELSPALRDLYESVRDATLLEMIRERYHHGRTASSQGRIHDAARAFVDVLRLSDELAPASAEDAADLTTLASGFLALAESAERPQPDSERVYTPADPSVAVPAAVLQRVPQPPDSPRADFTGTAVLELIISASGEVESAYLQRGIHPAYDRLVLDAAQTWRYIPATVGGQPVRFRKILQIDVR
jgi:TonB family protein